MEAINTTGRHAYKGSTLEMDREKQDKDFKIPAFLFSNPYVKYKASRIFRTHNPVKSLIVLTAMTQVGVGLGLYSEASILSHEILPSEKNGGQVRVWNSWDWRKPSHSLLSRWSPIPNTASSAKQQSCHTQLMPLSHRPPCYMSAFQTLMGKSQRAPGSVTGVSTPQLWWNSSGTSILHHCQVCVALSDHHGECKSSCLESERPLQTCLSASDSQESDSSSQVKRNQVRDWGTWGIPVSFQAHMSLE